MMGPAQLWAISEVNPIRTDPVMTRNIYPSRVRVHLYSKTVIASASYSPIMNHIIRTNGPIAHSPAISHHWSTGKRATIKSALILRWGALLIRPIPLIAHDNTNWTKMNCLNIIKIAAAGYRTKKNINSRKQCPSELKIFCVKNGKQAPVIY